SVVGYRAQAQAKMLLAAQACRPNALDVDLRLQLHQLRRWIGLFFVIAGRQQQRGRGQGAEEKCGTGPGVTHHFFGSSVEAVVVVAVEDRSLIFNCSWPSSPPMPPMPPMPGPLSSSAALYASSAPLRSPLANKASPRVSFASPEKAPAFTLSSVASASSA